MGTSRTVVAIIGRLLVGTGVLLVQPGGIAAAAPPSIAADTASPAACRAEWRDLGLDLSWTKVTDLAMSAGRVWAAGLTARPGRPRHPIVSRELPHGWASVPVPRTTEETGLFGIDVSSHQVTWAVGYETHDLIYRPYVLTGGRGGLRRVALPVPVRAGSLTDVLALPEGMVTVGFETPRTGEVPIAIHRSDGRWSLHRLPSRRGRPASLLAVAGADESSLWAGGWQRTGSGVAPYLAHWNGRSWARIGARGLAGAEGAILDLAVGQDEVAWAVGYEVHDGRMEPLAWNRDGSRWDRLPPLLPGVTPALITGIDATSSGAVVTGEAWDRGRGRWAGFAARWTGDTWVISVPGDRTDRFMLRGVEVPGDGGPATMVGELGERSLAMDWCADAAGAASDDGFRVSHRAEPQPAGALPAGRGPTVGRPVAAPSSGRLRARDVAKQAGIAEWTQTHGGTVADLDRDGWPDLLISRHSGPALLALDRGGRFVKPRGAPFPVADRHGCDAADADADGDVDLYCALGAEKGAGLKVNELWLRQADGHYAPAPAGLGAADPFGRAREVTFFDLDHDAWPDLFVANKVPRTDGLPGASQVLTRTRDAYVPVGTRGFDASMGIVCLHDADLDGDGWEDLVVCRRDLNDPGAVGITWLRNEHGVLRDRTGRLGLTRRLAMDALPVDLDRDGRLDLVEITPTRLIVHLRRGGRYVAGAEAPLSLGRSVAAGDVDGDRDPDLYVVQGSGADNPPDRMYLVGAGGNRLDRFTIPSTTSGGADRALAIDHDRNGLSDFVVLNGAEGAGPIQLIAFFRD